MKPPRVASSRRPKIERRSPVEKGLRPMFLQETHTSRKRISKMEVRYAH